MPQYCLIKHRIENVTIDGADPDRNPDRNPVTGMVTFTPLLGKGDAVVITENGEKTTLTLSPIEARITNGELWHRGEPGVKLFAGGPDTNPERIRYRAKFTNLIGGGRKVELKDTVFEAAPGGEMELSTVQPAPAQPYPGYTPSMEAAISEISAVRDSSIDYATTKIGEYRDEALDEADLAIQAAKDANTVPRVVALEAMNGVSPESPADGQQANLISQPGTLSRAAVEEAATKAVFERLPEYVVGPTGRYATLDDFFVDHPTGEAKVTLQAGTHYVSSLPSDGTIMNLAIVGQGSEWRGATTNPVGVTTVVTDGPLIESVPGVRNLYFADFNLRNTPDTNTDNAIHTTYGVGIVVERLNIYGYGGSSVWLEGGVDCEVSENYIIARDRTRTNGHAGIHLSSEGGDNYARSITTTQLHRNNVSQALDQCYKFSGVTHGCISYGDIAEYTPIGFYFHSAPMTVISPYTEKCDVGLKSRDCNPLIIGQVRDELIQEWSPDSILIRERGAARISERWIDMGTGLLMSANDGKLPGNFDESLSIRVGLDNPNGRFTAPAGALFFQRSAPYGRSMWQKRTPTGNQGWLPVGNYTVGATEMTNANAWLNQNRYRGMVVFNEGTMMMYYSDGANPTSVWRAVHDRTTTITPTAT